jgi:hypothetical protein
MASETLAACPINREGCSMVQHTTKPIERIQCVGCGVSAPDVKTWNAIPRTTPCPRCAELEKALEEFEAATRELPLGHEDASRGASSYNWRKACLHEIRARAARGKEEQS